MIFTGTKLKGAYIIDIEKLEDERGFFARSWCQKEFEAHGLNPHLVQCDISFNLKKGTLRGMHYQAAPYEEAKLVRCVRGSIYDVMVDLRPHSSTYCQWIGVELLGPDSQVPVHGSRLAADCSLASGDRSLLTAHYRMLYLPEGFAHGFLTLEDSTEVFYQMSEFYVPNHARGFRWNDPGFGIEWPDKVKVISDRDAAYPDFSFEMKRWRCKGEERRGKKEEGRWNMEEANKPPTIRERIWM
jgi:dTDP-4-dehydrorhamnose 3,5-epimerase